MLLTRSAMCRCRYTIGTSISPSGVLTSILTPGPARSPALTCTNVMRRTRNCRDSPAGLETIRTRAFDRSEEHTSELQSLTNLVCRLLLEKKKNKTRQGLPKQDT